MIELDIDPRSIRPSEGRGGEASRAYRSTYRQGDLPAFGDFFWKHSEEIEDASVAGDVIPESPDDTR
jgi:hypothetical protein